MHDAPKAMVQGFIHLCLPLFLQTPSCQSELIEVAPKKPIATEDCHHCQQLLGSLPEHPLGQGLLLLHWGLYSWLKDNSYLAQLTAATSAVDLALGRLGLVMYIRHASNMSSTPRVHRRLLAEGICNPPAPNVPLGDWTRS